ncbi:MAG: hypothetical protein WC262_09905 [Bacteroidales bacterium]
MRRKISPRVEENAHAILKEVFGTSNAGAEFVLNSWPALYKRTIHDLKGRFDFDELMLMVDAMNGKMLTPGIAGQHIDANVVDGIDLDRLDEKWGIDGTRLKEKVGALSIFDRACLEWWIQGFWTNHDSWENQREGAEKYAATLI